MPRVVSEPRAPIAAPAPLAERADRAKAEIEAGGGEVLADHRGRLDGESRLHLVLEQGRCYRAWIGADGAFAARLDDEHGHSVAAGASELAPWLGERPICPRWTGSFALVVEAQVAVELAVLLARAP